MTVKSTLSVLVGLATLLVFGGALYYYWAYVMPTSAPSIETPPAAVPDTIVAAGPVVAVSAKSISITKQDGTTATFAITSTTAIVMAAEGRPGEPMSVGDIKKGALVLITPSAGDAATAETIVLLPAATQ